MPVIAALEKWRQEDHEFTVVLGYIRNSRTVWATGDWPVLNRERERERELAKHS